MSESERQTLWKLLSISFPLSDFGRVRVSGQSLLPEMVNFLLSATHKGQRAVGTDFVGQPLPQPSPHHRKHALRVNPEQFWGRKSMK